MRTPVTALLEYWLGELDASAAAALDEHLFSCAQCHARLRHLVELGRDVRDAVRAGRVGAILTPSFVARLQQGGLQVREYRLQPGGSVNCTVAAEDDLVVAHLHAPLDGIQRLDLVGQDTAGASWRLEDIAFTPGSDVALSTNVAALRQLSFATIRMELRAVDGTQERVIARYTFHHSPSRA
jgi:hypothetical protein